jgi:hypothetical protein
MATTNVSLASTLPSASTLTQRRRGCVRRVAARRRVGASPPDSSKTLCRHLTTAASAASSVHTTTTPAAAVALDAPPRWALVHARAVAVIAEVLVSRKDAQKVLRKALRPEWFGTEHFSESPGWKGDACGGGVNNAERAAIADAVLGVEVLRLRLAFILHTRVSSASNEALEAAGGADAFGADAVAALLRRGGIDAGSSTSDDGELELDRAAVVLAVEAMLALYWMRDDGDEEEGAAASGEDDNDGEKDASPPLAPSKRLQRGRQQMDEAKLAVLLGDDNAGSGATLSEGDWPTDPTARIAVEHSLPYWLAARFVAQYGRVGTPGCQIAYMDY